MIKEILQDYGDSCIEIKQPNLQSHSGIKGVIYEFNKSI